MLETRVLVQYIFPKKPDAMILSFPSIFFFFKFAAGLTWRSRPMEMRLIGVTGVKKTWIMKPESSRKARPFSATSPSFTHSVSDPTPGNSAQPRRQVRRPPVPRRPHVAFRARGSRSTPAEPTPWQNPRAYEKSRILHGEKGPWPPGRERRFGNINKSIPENRGRSSLGRHAPVHNITTRAARD